MLSQQGLCCGRPGADVALPVDGRRSIGVAGEWQAEEEEAEEEEEKEKEENEVAMPLFWLC